MLRTAFERRPKLVSFHTPNQTRPLGAILTAIPADKRFPPHRRTAVAARRRLATRFRAAPSRGGLLQPFPVRPRERQALLALPGERRRLILGQWGEPGLPQLAADVVGLAHHLP